MVSNGKLAAAKADLRSDKLRFRERGRRTVEALQRCGDAEATYAVGTWLLHGANGYARDASTAASYIQYAADRGVADAIYDLGQLTEAKRLGRRPRRDAFNRYLTAAMLGDRDAKDEVIRCVYYGVGTFADPQGAERIFDALNRNDQTPVAVE